LENAAKENLMKDLKLVALELNPIRKWKKLKNFGKEVLLQWIYDYDIISYIKS
jgi:hypothetical protein